MLREAYLDFYSKSLADGTNDSTVIPYSKRMNIEQREHERINKQYFSKGIAPPEMKINPLLSKESDIRVDSATGLGSFTLKPTDTFVVHEKDKSIENEKPKISALQKLKDKHAQKQKDQIEKSNEENSTETKAEKTAYSKDQP